MAAAHGRRRGAKNSGSSAASGAPMGSRQSSAPWLPASRGFSGSCQFLAGCGSLQGEGAGYAGTHIDVQQAVMPSRQCRRDGTIGSTTSACHGVGAHGLHPSRNAHGDEAGPDGCCHMRYGLQACRGAMAGGTVGRLLMKRVCASLQKGRSSALRRCYVLCSQHN